MAKKITKYTNLCMFIEDILEEFFIQLTVVVTVLINCQRTKRKRSFINNSYSMINKMPQQVRHLNRIVGVSDTDCIINLRMNRNAFGRLCNLMREVGSLCDGKYVTVEEQLAMFLSILAHHKKNRIMGFDFIRSGQTVSYYLHVVLKAILKLHTRLLVKPEPVNEDETDGRWKWFKVYGITYFSLNFLM